MPRTGRMVFAIGVLLLIFASRPLFAQSGVGTIQGAVFDQTGGALAGATVTVTDVARGISRPYTTDSAGQYVALNLTPGTYTVRAEAKGFQTVQNSNVVVEVGKNIRIDLTLQPGAQTQTVTVTSEAPAVDTSDAVLGGTVENSVMNALPLNGRNFQRLVELRPGIVTAIGSGTGLSSTNGLRTGDDLQLVDGIAAFAASTGNSVLNSSYRTGDSTSLLPIDAIQEFNTEQNPKAEYGWKAGSVVNIGIKSGTNTLHGTAYAFGRDTSLDASNPFTKQTTPLNLEQFGATAGGRIIKNKVFWFAGFEGLRWLSGVITPAVTPEDMFDPSDTSNQLSMVNACDFLSSTVANSTSGPYNAIGASGPNGVLNALSARLAGLSVNPTTGCKVSPASSTFENLWPFNPATSTTYVPSLVSTSPGYNGVFKGNYHYSDHNEFSGMYFRGQQDEQQAGPISPTWGTYVPAETQAFDGLWTWTPNSTWVNEFRAGLAYLDNETLATDRSVNPADPWGLGSNGMPTGYGIPTGINLSQFPLYGGAPELQISSGSFSYLGSGNKTSVRGPEGSIDVVEHVSYLHGAHAFKFGFEYLDAIFDGDTYNQGNGDIVFNDLQSFLSGTPNGGGAILLGNPAINMRGRNYAVFGQDDWRIKTRLTLNLGLRWNITQPYFERNNYVGNFNPNADPATTPAIEQAGPGAPLSQLYPTDWKAVSPRVGFAWDVQGNGKTVVRAAGDIVYGLLGGGDTVNTMPFGANYPTVNATAANPNGIDTSGTAINAHTSNLFLLTPSELTWNTTGPVFPGTVPTVVNNFNGVPTTYTGVTCLPPTATTIVNGTPVPNSGVPCSANTIAPNFIGDTPVGEWTLDIQRAITNNLTIDVAYVGNHAWDVPSQEMDINQPQIGTGWNVVNTSLGMSPAQACVNSVASNYSDCLGRGASKNNATTITNALLANEAANLPYAKQYPYLSYIDNTSNAYISNYNGVQVTVSERTSHGLNFIAGYTFAHALDDVSGEGSTAGPMNVYDPMLNYGNGANDIRNRFTFSATYTLPGWSKAPGQMLQGWSINAIVEAQGGLPYWPQDTSNDFSGTGEVFASTSSNATSVPFSWNYTGSAKAFEGIPGPMPCYGFLSGCTAYSKLPSGMPTTTIGNNLTVPTACYNAAIAPYKGNAQNTALATAALANYGCYMENGGIMTPPAFGTLGDNPRDFFRGRPYYNVDFSVTKDWKFRERFGAEFRAEFFNLFNWTDYGAPGTNAGGGARLGEIVNTLNATNPVLGSGGPRTIQFGLKLSY